MLGQSGSCTNATSRAYACVWASDEGADAMDRQPIFDALQASRRYGATAPIELRVTAQATSESEALRMGADLLPADACTIEVEALGTGPIERV